MSKVVFSGCSFTAGTGWDKNDITLDCKDDPNLWTNLCCSQIDQLQNLKVLNVGNGGASNLDIFLAALKTIVVHESDIDTLFCQWTSMPRYNFSVGFELWSTNEGIGLHKKHEHDVNLNRGETWNRKYLNDLLDRLLVLHHLHGEIVKLVEYSNILKKLLNNSILNYILSTGYAHGIKIILLDCTMCYQKHIHLLLKKKYSISTQETTMIFLNFIK